MKANVYHNNHKIKVFGARQKKIIRKNKKKVVVVTVVALKYY